MLARDFDQLQHELGLRSLLADRTVTSQIHSRPVPDTQPTQRKEGAFVLFGER